jgi:hypothetical protein
MRVNEDGTALMWGEGDGEIELSAVWASTLPAVGMRNAEFRQIMEKLGYTLEGMAKQLDISRRQVASYRDDLPIPNHIAFAARHLEKMAEEPTS